MSPALRSKFYKWIYIGALCFFAVILQSTLLSRIKVFGATPSIIPFVVAAIALLEGHEEGMIAGIVGGVMYDAAYSGHEGFYVIILPVLAFLICIMNTFMYWKNYYMSLLDWVVILVLMHAVHYCLFMLAVGEGTPMSLLYIIPGELVATLPFTPFIYMIIKKTLGSFKNFDE